MGRSYSLAVLLLVTAIVAMSLGSIRLLWLRVDAGASSDIAAPMLAGALGGAICGPALALWRGADWIWVLLALVGVLGLGAAAGAQLTAPVSWGVVVLGPLIVLGAAALVMVHSRRAQLRSQRGGDRGQSPFDEHHVASQTPWPEPPAQ